METMEKNLIFPNPVPAGRQAAFEHLRAKHPRFVYENFSWDCAGDLLRARFHFRLDPDLVFTPEVRFEQVDRRRLDSLPRAALENLFFHLGLIEMLSYWKAACSPQILVRAGTLDSEQAAWWLDLISHGMGEFFYVNKIDFLSPDFVRIVPASSDVIPGSAKDLLLPNAQTGSVSDLVLTSGGKDSVVTLEFLREAGRQFDCLLLNPTEAALAIARKAGCSIARVVRRAIDPRLLELNAAGYLNGHTPFSALLAFLGVTVAVLSGSSRIIVSNERSAEEASAEFQSRPVNHQYSKSFRFETAFRQYAQKHLAASADYFSLLRPLYELQIAALFAGYRQYFPLFRSCNRGMANNSWCGRCPKCLFVFAALYPFLERKQILAIFGEDLFAWDGAASGVLALLGLERDKPFECVGTKEETLAALYLCAQKYQEQGIELPPALRQVESAVLGSQPDLPARARRVLAAWTDQHYLPQELAEALRQRLQQIQLGL
jgi:hypothetical protein